MTSGESCYFKKVVPECFICSGTESNSIRVRVIRGDVFGEAEGKRGGKKHDRCRLSVRGFCLVCCNPKTKKDGEGTVSPPPPPPPPPILRQSIMSGDLLGVGGGGGGGGGGAWGLRGYKRTHFFLPTPKKKPS